MSPDEVRILSFDDPAELSILLVIDRGFKRKGARVRIITFRDTTRLQSNQTAVSDTLRLLFDF
jgi:hypothetical protein